MIRRKFNIAEAIIEPYYDGGESDMKYPETKLSMLPHYTQETDTPSLVRASQTWHSVNVDFDGCKPGGSFFEMKREFRLDVSDYDTLRLFGAMPKCMETTVSVKYDGAWHTLDTFPGNDTTSEHNMPLPCKVLEGVGYRFFLQENKPASATLHWLGLVNQPLLETYLRQKTGMYSPEWEDYLKPEDGAFEPQIGIWFDKDELETLRKKVMSMFTDPGHLRVEDPGKIEGNTVFTYLDAFCKPDAFEKYLPEYKDLDELKAHYQRGGLGDVKVKKFLFAVLNEFLTPIRERRAYFEAHPEEVIKTLTDGTEEARRVAAETLEDVKKAMQIDYFNQWAEEYGN